MLLLSFRLPSPSSRPGILNFSHSAYLQQKKEDEGPLFQVNNEQLSYSAVEAVTPGNRTIAHWQVLVDWALQATRPYVIVDPFDPSGLLYLSYQEYLVQSRTLGTMNTPFIVVARPGSKKPEAVSKPKTPPYQRSPWVGVNFDPITWRKMKDLRTFISRNVSWGKGDTVKVNDGNIMGLVFVWTRELLHYLHVKKPAAAQDQFFGFGKHLQEILRHNGPDFLIKRLKILLFALYSFVGGNPLKSTEPLGQRIKLSNGLPTVFPRELRESFRCGSLQRVRVWASLLNIYKYLQGTHGEPPLETIGAPPFQGDISSFQNFCTAHDGFFKLLEEEIGQLPEFDYESAMGKSIVSAGANTSCSLNSIPFDAIAWSKTENLPLKWFEINGDRKAARFMKKVLEEARYQWGIMDLGAKSGRYVRPKRAEDLRTFLKKLKTLFPLNDDLHRHLTVTEGAWEGFAADLPKSELDSIRRLLAPWNDKAIMDHNDDTFAVNLWLLARRGLWTEKISFSEPVTGRLIAIPEPAGKVRVVAACDYFTQIGLYPLHKFLFQLLRPIPTDATFDQEGAVNRFAARGHKNIYSYDLKSATDLIPWQLYKPIMMTLVGTEKAELWLRLLRDRDFWMKQTKSALAKNPDLPTEIQVRYSRGQPMGAYSSWGLLAVVHHALVQFAAYSVGYKRWFQDYLVLGDDIVIASDEVGQKYLDLCNQYGITVGLPKSLTSNKGLMNFASQTLIGKSNISPISFKEELNSNSWDRRLEFANRIDRRWGDSADDGPASLRRVLTYAQWQFLQQELQGKEWKYTLGFVLFILQQPFREVGCHIGKIVSWLGLLSPELKTLPGELVLELEASIKYSIWSTLLSEYQAHCETCISFQRTRINVEGAPGETGPTGFKTVWTYLGREVFKAHINDSIYERLMELSPKIDAIDTAFTEAMPTTDASRSEALPPLSEIVELWDEYSRIPKLRMPEDFDVDFRMHILDILRSVQVQDLRKAKSVLKQNPRWEILPSWYSVKESLHAPLREISVAVAKVLGVKLPFFPLINRHPPQSLRKALRLAVGHFMDTRITRDASPHMRRLDDSEACPENPVP